MLLIIEKKFKVLLLQVDDEEYMEAEHLQPYKYEQSELFLEILYEKNT
jgi:hypothetical protein